MFYALRLLPLVAILFGCQHNGENRELGMARGEAEGECEEPQFEMVYRFSSTVIPEYIDLGVDMKRATGPFFARFGKSDDQIDFEIRIEDTPEGLLAKVSGRSESGNMQEQAEGLIINRYGLGIPFMLVIETSIGVDGLHTVKVKAREMTDNKNGGIVSGEGVAGTMPTAGLEYLVVSSHHRGLIVSEGAHIREFFRMKNGSAEGETVDQRKFQDIAESYLDCLKLETGEAVETAD